jgi:hypothetical protein
MDVEFHLKMLKNYFNYFHLRLVSADSTNFHPMIQQGVELMVHSQVLNFLLSFLLPGLDGGSVLQLA